MLAVLHHFISIMSSEKEAELIAKLEAAQKEIDSLKEEVGILRKTCSILRNGVDEGYAEIQKLQKEKAELEARIEELSKH